MVEWFGTAAAAAMVGCYALEERDPRFTLGFAASCVGASAYAYAIGSWPFFVLEGLWALIAARRGWHRVRASQA